MIAMRRILMWFLSTVTVVVLMFGYHTSTVGAMTAAPTTVIPASRDKGGSSASAAAPGATTVSGPVVSTQWGPVQVQIATDGGTITGVTVLQHPTGNSRDQLINDYALPILVRETLDAQSADVHMVSGATVTSGGYVRSLQAALDEARL